MAEIDFGKRIAELRVSKKMTQAQLGGLLFVSSQAVSKWERGLCEPGLSMTKKLCEILDVSISDFFSDEPLKVNTTDVDVELKDLEETESNQTFYYDSTRSIAGMKTYPWSICFGVFGILDFFSIVVFVAISIIVNIISASAGN